MTIVTIESLDNEGRGIAHVDGKVIFIEGALPGELVEFSSYRRKPSYEQATVTKVLRASSQRVTPACPHFGVCGGCALQHLNIAAQTAAKQRVVEDALWHIGRLKPEQIYPPIAGSAWGYRHRARFSARWVAKKGGALIGFREKHSSFVAVMDSCAVLPPVVSALIPKLKQLIALMSEPEHFPQIEVAVGEVQTVLLLRHLSPLSGEDEDHLRRFAAHGVVWFLQSKGPETVALFYPENAPSLMYALPDFDLTFLFSPTEFTQVNTGVNRMLVRRAMALLDPQPGERIVDLFCGLGNFTLPIGRLGATVVGIEGSAALVRRAAENAARNGLSGQCSFAEANLFEVTEASFAALGKADKLLIDPPREGALALVNALPAVSSDEQGKLAPWRIVYVSCNPATLARDAGILVNDKGYALKGAGIASMFPHTAHVESIAVFER
ncbi:MAG TPA: 23S rRNA (uracil(1939)-C(5))-methyltransferase RlmD [Rugosibacter sp.]|nr:23S rRNA (uracil(1939)-C(5))-methyltransferase RlmD [Rugosibacter sp.]